MTLYKFAKLVGGEDIIIMNYPDGKTETLEGCILLHALAYDDPGLLSLEVRDIDRHINDYGNEVIEVWTGYGEHYLSCLNSILGDAEAPTIEESCILLNVCDKFSLEIEDHFDSITMGQIGEVAKLSGCSRAEVFSYICNNGVRKEA